MAKSNKKLTKSQKLLIRDGILAGGNIVGGITGLALATSPFLAVIAGATLVAGGIWSFFSAKLTKKVICDKKNGVVEIQEPKIKMSFRERRSEKKEHKQAYKQALKNREEAEKSTKKDFKDKKQFIKNEEGLVDKKKAYNESLRSVTDDQDSIKAKKQIYQEASQHVKARVGEAKLEEKGTLKTIPKKAKKFKVARGFAITLATLSSAITLGCGILLADNYISAHASANEVSSSIDGYLKVEAATNNALGLTLAGLNIANAVVATTVAKKRARKREDEIIEKYGDGVMPDTTASIDASYTSGYSAYTYER